MMLGLGESGGIPLTSAGSVAPATAVAAVVVVVVVVVLPSLLLVRVSYLHSIY